MNYGSCGFALSGTFSEMVVDWREDWVYNFSKKTAYINFDYGLFKRTDEMEVGVFMYADVAEWQTRKIQILVL